MTEPSSFSLLEAVHTHLRKDFETDSDRTPSPGSKSLTENPSTRVPEPFPQIPDLFDGADESNLPTMTTEQEAFEDAFVADMRDEAFSKGSQPKLVNVRVPAGPKKELLDGIKEALTDPNLRVATRQHFIELTNSTIYLNSILFCRASEFLWPEDVAESQEIVNGMMRYIGLIDDMLVDLLEVARHLKKPRSLEQKLLELYREFFDGWVHAKFLRKRNTQILTEGLADMGRLKLTRYMRAVWDVLTRCIENYALYRVALDKIKEQRLAHILAHVHLSSVPAIGEWFGELP